MKNGKPRSVLGLVFLTVFLDIVGFSVIFPLFPGMLDHYLGLEGDASTIGRLVAWISDAATGQSFADLGSVDRNSVATLFGGVLGSIYSTLQFVFAPLWGALSDRIGRRPTLLITLFGTVVGYALWVFAGSFGVLVGARVLGGIMAGNISTASAAVADSTTGRQRAAGMGIVGMAIGLGFILGPALGALALQLPELGAGSAGAAFALNPFSTAALLALSLSLLNLAWVVTRLPETLAPEKRGHVERKRVINPFRRLARLDFPGVARVNFAYLLFLTAFSAMEFTLTFLAVQRFDYGYGDNAKMFVFVGFVIAIVQGGVVRRMAPRLGEKKLALGGLALCVPGFVAIGVAEGQGVLYLGLLCMAVGSALVTPCLSSLVSRYTPGDRQGLSLGVFRSMGSLSRAVGPLLGGLLYWRFGSASPYLCGAVFLLLPLVLSAGLPPVPPDAHEPEETGEAAGDAPAPA